MQARAEHAAEAHAIERIALGARDVHLEVRFSNFHHALARLERGDLRQAEPRRDVAMRAREHRWWIVEDATERAAQRDERVAASRDTRVDRVVRDRPRQLAELLR